METLALILSVAAILLSTILSVVTIHLSKKTLTRYHEGSRREKAIELLLYWSNNLDKKLSLVRKYVEQLDKKQTEKLFNQEEIVFDEKNRLLCTQIKELLGIDNTGDSLRLTSAECAELRWTVFSYLNMLETILTAWRHRVADTDIIEEEFSYLVGVNRNKKILDEFIQAASGRCTYTSIEKFCNHLKEKYEKEHRVRKSDL